MQLSFLVPAILVFIIMYLLCINSVRETDKDCDCGKDEDGDQDDEALEAAIEACQENIGQLVPNISDCRSFYLCAGNHI